MRIWVLSVVVLLAAATSSFAGAAAVPSPSGLAPVAPPNILVIITDDQRWDTLWAMPKVKSLLAAKGITFSNAFTVNPVCCPSRAAFLTGNYSHTTGVYGNRSNKSIWGGFANFHDSSTLATWLDPTYATGLFGKYLNGYGENGGAQGYVPPGWDRWLGILGGEYTNVRYSSDGVIESPTGDGSYSTDYLAGKADAFIRSTSEPVFVYFAPQAPHAPFIPKPDDASLYQDLSPWRPPSYNEADMRDKPSHRGWPRPLSVYGMAALDKIRLNQLRTLASLDRAVGRLVTALSDTGRLDNTLILFTSDNGFMWGEHRADGKNNPYEEAIRLPFVMRYDPGIVSPGSVDSHIVANIDLAPTILDLTGIPGAATDGDSLVPLLSGTPAPWRDLLLIEHGWASARSPSYCEVRTARYMLTVHADRTRELYDLQLDPYELTNVVRDPNYSSVASELSTRMRSACQPLPPYFPAGIIQPALHPHEARTLQQGKSP